MSYAKDMKRCLDYLDSHLDDKISVGDLAAEMGYSLYHFSRLFKSIQGISPGMYLQKRRLEQASVDLLRGKSVTDAAFRCGYDTTAGFYKAFRKHFGVSPEQYIQEGDFHMIIPEIKTLDTFMAVGYSFAPPAGEFKASDAPAYWLGKDFSSVDKAAYADLAASECGEIGAWMHPDDTSGDLYYFFGPIVENFDVVPETMVTLKVPAAEYAVFNVPKAENAKALHENIQKAWKYIFGEWFDQSEWKFDETKMDFEFYQKDVTQIFVPVVKK